MFDGIINEVPAGNGAFSHSRLYENTLEALKQSDEGIKSEAGSLSSAGVLPGLHICDLQAGKNTSSVEGNSGSGTSGDLDSGSREGIRRDNFEASGEMFRQVDTQRLLEQVRLIAESIIRNGSFGDGPDQKELREALRLSRDSNLDPGELINRQLDLLNSPLRIHAQITNLLKSEPPVEVWSLDLFDRASLRRRDNLELHYQQSR